MENGIDLKILINFEFWIDLYIFVVIVRNKWFEMCDKYNWIILIWNM